MSNVFWPNLSMSCKGIKQTLCHRPRMWRWVVPRHLSADAAAFGIDQGTVDLQVTNEVMAIEEARSGPLSTEARAQLAALATTQTGSVFLL